MKLTMIHPAIGRRVGQKYMRSWQMEPLQPALLTALTPPDVDMRFYDDRMEPIPFDEPTDLVAVSVETYTARRAYQIASEYRQRGVPVVMGGFHASLCPEEVGRYAEAVVIGEAEGVWPRVIDDVRHGTLQRQYRNGESTPLCNLRYDRRLFRGKNYLPVTLIEAGRGCKFRCEFCAVQSFYNASHRLRPVDEIVRELEPLRDRTKLFFFVDDNFAGNIPAAKELLRALIPLRIRWVTQMSINAAHDEEFLDLLKRSGCAGVLIGFETLNPDVLSTMGKSFNIAGGGYSKALANLRRHRIRLYATFVFGYDGDTAESMEEALEFALQERFFIAAFNHLTPFPGTPLYRRLENEGRMLFDSWWMDPSYRYNGIPYRPLMLSGEALQARCLNARHRFYSMSSLMRRVMDSVNGQDAFMFFQFFLINWMMRLDQIRRNDFPLGDAGWQGELVTVR